MVYFTLAINAFYHGRTCSTMFVSYNPWSEPRPKFIPIFNRKLGVRVINTRINTVYTVYRHDISK